MTQKKIILHSLCHAKVEILTIYSVLRGQRYIFFAFNEVIYYHTLPPSLIRHQSNRDNYS